MRITLKKIIKAIVPYGIIFLWRRRKKSPSISYDGTYPDPRYYAPHYYGGDGEDVLLRLFCGGRDKSDKKGFYVDIGAFHPFTYSNTQFFYEVGWNGINIDANPDCIVLFNKHRRRDININAGVSDKCGELEFYSFLEPALNSFDRELSQSRIESGMRLKDRLIVKVYTINQLLEKYLPVGQHITFMTIDVEGYEMKILQSLDFKKYAPDYFIVEDLDSQYDDFMDFRNSPLYIFLKSKSYVVIAKTRLSILFKNISKQCCD